MSEGERSNRPRVVYLHGDGVLYWSWGWVKQVRDTLVESGFPTFFELFPDSIEARAQYWLPFLDEHVRVTERDVLLGWSCGAVAAMRFASRHPVRGLVLVAPYYSDLGLESVRRSGWVTEQWDWPRLRANAGAISIFHSDNDPYIAQEEFSTLRSALQAEAFVFPGAGHFGEQETFPELASHISRVYG
jgi:uncharacterized protein